MMTWTVLFHPDFREELRTFAEPVREELVAAIYHVVNNGGPNVGRPYVDTLEGSKYFNMKELRFLADNGVWRAAFAFDPKRRAVVFVAGNKTAKNQRRFYLDLIRIADLRYADHLEEVEREGNAP